MFHRKTLIFCKVTKKHILKGWNFHVRGKHYFLVFFCSFSCIKSPKEAASFIVTILEINKLQWKHNNSANKKSGLQRICADFQPFTVKHDLGKPNLVVETSAGIVKQTQLCRKIDSFWTIFISHCKYFLYGEALFITPNEIFATRIFAPTTRRFAPTTRRVTKITRRVIRVTRRVIFRFLNNFTTEKDALSIQWNDN